MDWKAKVFRYVADAPLAFFEAVHDGKPVLAGKSLAQLGVQLEKRSHVHRRDSHLVNSRIIVIPYLHV